MKVWIVASGLPSSKYPLRGIFEYQQATALSKHIEITYLHIDLRAIHKNNRIRRNEIRVSDNLKIIEWRVPTVGRYTPAIVFNLICGSIITYETKFIEKSLIHFHFGDFALKFRGFINRTIHSTIVSEYSSNIYKLANNTRFVKKMTVLYNSVDLVIPVSASLSDFLFHNYSVVNSSVIPIMVSKIFNYDPIQPKYNQFTFVSVSSIDSNKNVELTMKAFLEEYQNQADFCLIVIGEGPLLKRLLESTTSKQVKFLGYRSREEIFEVFKKSHVFVLPSIIETFGAVYIEAMATGIPVIANKAAGPLSIINDQNGLIIKENSVESMREAMRQMVNNYRSYNPQIISDYVKQNFSEEVITMKILSLYQDLYLSRTS